MRRRALRGVPPAEAVCPGPVPDHSAIGYESDIIAPSPNCTRPRIGVTQNNDLQADGKAPGAEIVEQFSMNEFDLAGVGQGRRVVSGIIGLGPRLSTAGWDDPGVVTHFELHSV